MLCLSLSYLSLPRLCRLGATYVSLRVLVVWAALRLLRAECGNGVCELGEAGSASLTNSTNLCPKDCPVSTGQCPVSRSQVRAWKGSLHTCDLHHGSLRSAVLQDPTGDVSTCTHFVECSGPCRLCAVGTGTVSASWYRTANATQDSAGQRVRVVKGGTLLLPAIAFSPRGLWPHAVMACVMDTRTE